MFTKANLIRNGVPTLVAFVILYFLGDRYVLPAVFSATDSGNMNLLNGLPLMQRCYYQRSMELDGHFSSLALSIIG